MVHSIDRIMADKSTSGPGWASAMQSLEKYRDACQLRIEVDTSLKQTYAQAFALLDEYLAGDDLDDSEIPQYEAKIKELTQSINEANDTITKLNKDNIKLSQVKPVQKTVKDENGKDYTYTDYTDFNAAQAQIEANNNMIASLQSQIEVAEAAREEAEIYLGRLRGLAEVVNKANNMISDAVNNINNQYCSYVNSINPVNVEVLEFNDMSSSRFATI